MPYLGRRLWIEVLECRHAMDGNGLIVNGDQLAVHENAPQLELNVLANDVFGPDYAGAGRITSVSYGSEGGQVEINAAGNRLLYAPPADFAGVETFVYAVDGVHVGTVTVTIASPLADDVITGVRSGATITLDVLANDPFWDGYSGPRKITSISAESGSGTLTIAPDGKSILYQAEVNPDSWRPTETFLYVVDNLYAAQVTLQLESPLHADRFELIQQDPPKTLDVLANDPFWDGYTGEGKITHVRRGTSSTWVVVGENPPPPPGEFAIAADGKSIIYTSTTSGAQGATDTLVYVVDGLYETNVTIVIRTPVADDHVQVDSNSTDFFFDVTANDLVIYERDAWGQPSHFEDLIDVVAAVTQPTSGGTVSIATDGKGIVYTPAADFSGTDTFTYTADGKHVATVRVTVSRPVRDDQFAGGGWASPKILQDTPDQLLDVLANDFIGNGYSGPRVITAVGATAHGGTVTVRSDGGALLYTPAAGYIGPDTFTYTIDGTHTATVTVSVSPLVVNDTLVIKDYVLGASHSYSLLANDHFQRGYIGPKQVTGIELVSGGGTIAWSPDGQVTVTLTKSSATFRYVVDGRHEGTFSVFVQAGPDPDSFAVEQNASSQHLYVTANDFRIHSYYSPTYTGPMRVTAVSTATQGGTVALDSTGRGVIYTPPADFIGTDTFTYTVDDFFTETVTIEVFRRVRDDLFRVDQTDGPQSLAVLANDPLGGGYAGIGHITAVTPSAAGATVTIASDGHTIVYTPAPGFVGTDTLVYTVDDQFKAEVSIVVDAPAANQVPTFGSDDEYFAFLLQKAFARFANQFGAPAYSFGPILYDTNGTVAGAGANPRGHSETNVQVAGVDEGDIIEFDQDYVYVLHGDELVIVDAWPAEDSNIISRSKVTGKPVAQYLWGDRLTVISTQYTYSGSHYGGGGGTIDDVVLSTDWFFPRLTEAKTIVTIFDVSDRTSPQLVQETTLDGQYINSRSIDGRMTLALSHTPADALQLQVIDDDNDPLTIGRYETRDEFVARVTAAQGEVIAQALPHYTARDGQRDVVRSGMLVTPQLVHQPLSSSSTELLTLVSFDAHSDEPGLTDTTAVYTTSASATVYAAPGSFYIVDTETSAEDYDLTRVVKFDWNADLGTTELVATTTVRGHVVDQFAIDEYHGHLRIATTVGNRWSGLGNENVLYVLREDDGVLEAVGALQNWALGETIESIRFLGDRAFATTAQQYDPLFALDLTDAANPRAVGHLTLPGFATYTHLIDANHLVTVGRNSAPGSTGPTQVSLFDISNLSQPIRIAQHTFERFSTSLADIDHHAFGYFAEHGLLTIPVSNGRVERFDEDGDGYSETRRWVNDHNLAVFHIDTSDVDPAQRLQWAAEIEHHGAVLRSGYIGDKLFSLGSDALNVVDVANLSQLVASIELPALPQSGGNTVEVLFGTPISLSLVANNTISNPPPPTAAIDPRAAGFAQAREHLAQRLGIAPGEALLLAAQATPHLPGGGEVVSLRVGDNVYWYRISSRGDWQAVDDRFAFDATSDTWQRMLVPTVTGHSNATDFNGDGVVNHDDAPIWRASFGRVSLVDQLAADANFDGRVDAADYTLWRDSVLSPATPPATLAIDEAYFGYLSPEPPQRWSSRSGGGEMQMLDAAEWARQSDLLLLSQLAFANREAEASTLPSAENEPRTANSPAPNSGFDQFSPVDWGLI